MKRILLPSILLLSALSVEASDRRRTHTGGTNSSDAISKKVLLKAAQEKVTELTKQLEDQRKTSEADITTLKEHLKQKIASSNKELEDQRKALTQKIETLKEDFKGETTNLTRKLTESCKDQISKMLAEKQAEVKKIEESKRLSEKSLECQVGKLQSIVAQQLKELTPVRAARKDEDEFFETQNAIFDSNLVVKPNGIRTSSNTWVAKDHRAVMLNLIDKAQFRSKLEDKESNTTATDLSNWFNRGLENQIIMNVAISRRVSNQFIEAIENGSQEIFKEASNLYKLLLHGKDGAANCKDFTGTNRSRVLQLIAHLKTANHNAVKVAAAAMVHLRNNRKQQEELITLTKESCPELIKELDDSKNKSTLVQSILTMLKEEKQAAAELEDAKKTALEEVAEAQLPTETVLPDVSSAVKKEVEVTMDTIRAKLDELEGL